MRARLRRQIWWLLGCLQGKRRICAWCPDFNRADPKNAGADHGMCPSCAAKLRAELREA